MLLSVEWLRGLAAFMVVACHYLPHLGGGGRAFGFFYIGVSLFFVISGYVFAPYVLGKQVAPWRYLARRFFRIYPLYILSLVAYMALRVLERQGLEVWPVMAHLVFLQNLFYLKDYLTSVYWTLPVEFFFYLLVLAFAFGKLRMWVLWVGVLIHIAAVRVLFFNDLIDLSAAAMAANSVFFRFPDFFLGVVVYRFSTREAPPSAKWGWVGLGVLAVCWWYWVSLGGEEVLLTRGVAHTVYSVLVPVGMALVLFMALSMEAQFQRVQRLALLMGGLSYGLYLFHMVPPRLASWAGWALTDPHVLAACAAASVCVAYGLHRCVEQPFIRLGRRLAA